EHPTMLLHSLHYALALAYGMCHRLFAPYILAGICRIDRHNPMPVWRCGNMHNVYLREFQQFAVVAKGFYTFIQRWECLSYVSLIHITDRNYLCAFVFKMTTT